MSTFEQFEKRMDDRHREIIERLNRMRCSDHEKRIQRLEVWPQVAASIMRIGGSVVGVVALVAAVFEIVKFVKG